MRILTELIGFFILMVSCDEASENIHNQDKELQMVFVLPAEIKEASGMIFYDSLLWTFNDSGNEPIIFGVDTTDGSIRKKITLQNVNNIDWEDIAQDDTTIFIGDIGNGSGDKDTLRIYELCKTEITDSAEQSVSVNTVSFIFEDQTDFESASYATSYDCEALICIEDSLYIFTKDWINSNTVLYSLPKTPGYYHAKRIKEIHINGLVAGATYNPTNKQIALCGYTENYIPFLTLINLNESLNINDENLIRYNFYESFGVQIEGIDYSGNQLFLVSEKSAQPQSFFKFR